MNVNMVEVWISRSFGNETWKFTEFSTPEEAAEWVAKMNATTIVDGWLYVKDHDKIHS